MRIMYQSARQHKLNYQSLLLAPSFYMYTGLLVAQDVTISQPAMEGTVGCLSCTSYDMIATYVPSSFFDS